MESEDYIFITLIYRDNYLEYTKNSYKLTKMTETLKKMWTETKTGNSYGDKSGT